MQLINIIHVPNTACSCERIQTNNPTSIYSPTKCNTKHTEASPQIATFQSTQTAIVRLDHIEPTIATEVLSTGNESTIHRQKRTPRLQLSTIKFENALCSFSCRGIAKKGACCDYILAQIDIGEVGE